VLVRDRAEMLEQTGCWVLKSVCFVYHHYLIVAIIVFVVILKDLKREDKERGQDRLGQDRAGQDRTEEDE
jgi:hypothetical protein